MACSKLEARGHLLHKTGTPPKHFSHECNWCDFQCWSCMKIRIHLLIRMYAYKFWFLLLDVTNPIQTSTRASHTIRKYKKMAGQNTFQILVLNDANMIGEHLETRMEMLYGCPFERNTFLPRINTNSGFGRDWDTLWKKFQIGTFIALQIKVFGHKKFQIPCTGSQVPNWQFLWNKYCCYSMIRYFKITKIYICYAIDCTTNKSGYRTACFRELL